MFLAKLFWKFQLKTKLNFRIWCTTRYRFFFKEFDSPEKGFCSVELSSVFFILPWCLGLLGFSNCFPLRFCSLLSTSTFLNFVSFLSSSFTVPSSCHLSDCKKIPRDYKISNFFHDKSLLVISLYFALIFIFFKSRF